MKLDPVATQARHEDNLRKAQTLHEESVKAFLIAVEVESNCIEAYRKRKLKGLEEAKTEGYPPSSRTEVAKLKAHKEEKEMNMATGKKKQCQYWIDAYKERGVNIRHVGRDIESGLVR